MLITEIKMLITEITKTSNDNPAGTYEERVTFQLTTIAAMLMDISKNLAIIADREVEE